MRWGSEWKSGEVKLIGGCGKSSGNGGESLGKLNGEYIYLLMDKFSIF